MRFADYLSRVRLHPRSCRRHRQLQAQTTAQRQITCIEREDEFESAVPWSEQKSRCRKYATNRRVRKRSHCTCDSSKQPNFRELVEVMGVMSFGCLTKTYLTKDYDTIVVGVIFLGNKRITLWDCWFSLFADANWLVLARPVVVSKCNENPLYYQQHVTAHRVTRLSQEIHRAQSASASKWQLRPSNNRLNLVERGISIVACPLPW